MSLQRALSLCLAVLGLGLASPAAALPLVDLDFGVKGGVNAALLVVEPNFEHDWAQTLYEDDDAFGVAGGGGIYGQVRLLDSVGLEVDLLFSRDQTRRTEKFSGAGGYVKLDHTDWANNLRIPVLLKGFWGLGPVSLSLGAGIEWVHALSTGHDLEEAESLNASVSEEQLDVYRKSLTSSSADALFLLGQLELAIELAFLTIPIDLRVGRNLSQSDTFEDRYDYTFEQTGPIVRVTGADIAATYSWDFRLLTGIAYSF